MRGFEGLWGLIFGGVGWGAFGFVWKLSCWVRWVVGDFFGGYYLFL